MLVEERSSLSICELECCRKSRKLSKRTAKGTPKWCQPKLSQQVLLMQVDLWQGDKLGWVYKNIRQQRRKRFENGKKQSVSQLRFRRQNKIRTIANWKRFPNVYITKKWYRDQISAKKTNQYEKCFPSFKKFFGKIHRKTKD